VNRSEPDNLARGKRRWALALAGAGVLAAALGGAALAWRPGQGAGLAPPFRLGRVQAEDLQVSVREVGVVDPSTKVEVKANVSGRVTAIKVREGALVRRGDLLAEVEPGVTQAQSLSAVQGTVSKARVAFEHSQQDFTRQAALYRQGLLSERDYRQAESDRDLAKADLDAARANCRIVEGRGIPISGNPSAQLARVAAPMDGVVITRGVELGDTITSGVDSYNAGTVLFTVADLRSLIIRVNLNEVDIAKVRVGQAVSISLDAFPQRGFPGRVRFVAPAAEEVEKVKVFKIEIALDGQMESLRPGMSANVEILGDHRARALSVPLEALQRRDGQTVVYRLRRKIPPGAMAAARDGLAGRSRFVWLSDHWHDYFEVVPVQAGIATLERMEIRSGLAGDDQVCLEDPTRKRVEKDDDNF